MAAFAELRAFMGLDTGQYKAGVKEVTSLTSSFQKSISGIGGMLAGAFSVGAIIAFGKNLMGLADNMKNVAEATNLTMGQLTALKSIGAENNIRFDELAKVLNKVKDAQGSVVSLSKTQTDALDKLNISADEFVGAGTDQALEMLAKAYVNANGSAEAFAAVNEILGVKLGPKLIEMFKALDKEGLSAIAERTKEATKGFEELAAAQSTIENFFNRVQMAAAKAIGAVSEFGAEMGKIAANKPEQGILKTVFSSLGNMYYQGKYDEYTPGTSEGAGAKPANAFAGIHTRTPDQIKRDENLAAEAKKKSDKENEKAQELGRRYYFKELRNQDAIEELYADYQKQMAGLSKVKGQGASVDNMMRIGGMVGGVRPGLAAADRQLRVQEESKNLLREMSAKLQKLIDKQDIERDRNEG